MAIYFVIDVVLNIFTSPTAIYYFEYLKRLLMKLKIALPCLGIFLGSLFHQATAQNITVSGNVKNKSTGQPLIGATVTVSGTSKSTSTNTSGDFSIAAQKGAFLVITNISI